MSRVKRGTTSLKRRKNILSQVTGYQFGRSTKQRQATEAIHKAGAYAFAHRKDKKGDRRRLWQVKINGAVRAMGTTYSQFINMMKKKNIEVDRKIMADMIENNPESFKRVFETVTK